MAWAGVVGCSSCLDLHYFMTHNRGLDEAKAREVPRWRESTVFTPLERRVMEYAEAMSRTPVAVTDEMSAALLSDLGPAALVELTFDTRSPSSSRAAGSPACSPCATRTSCAGSTRSPSCGASHPVIGPDHVTVIAAFPIGARTAIAVSGARQP
jgi:AhpD family alkylhydroperoxidase